MKIVVVCGCGVGSSMVLKIYIDKALAKLGVDATVEQADVTVAKSTSADIIVTSATFAELVEEGAADAPQVVTITNYTDVNEYAEKLQQALDRIDRPAS